ncbi:hypothetical protein DSECCO2_238640 [anaerobic digester metagenome]
MIVGDCTFNLPNFDSQTPQLDLVIQTSEYMVLAVFIPAGKVPTPVVGDAVAGDELFLVEFLPVPVSPGHPHSTHVQLPDYSTGEGVTIQVHDFLVNIQEGFTHIDVS